MALKSIARTLVVSMILLAGFTTIFSMTSIADYSSVGILINGPTDIALDSSAEYTLMITGGPAENAEGELWWRYDAYLDMENRSGSPGVDPSTGNSTSNIFKFNVTAPSAEQIITLVVNGYSETKNVSKMETRRIQIRIVKPVVLSTKISNHGNVAVNGVPVVFYANQNEVARVTVDIQPGETRNVSVNWTSYVSDLYTITVKVDPDGRFMNLRVEENVLSMDVHVGEKSNFYTWIYAAILIVMSFIASMMIMGARQQKRPASKWK